MSLIKFFLLCIEPYNAFFHRGNFILYVYIKPQRQEIRIIADHLLMQCYCLLRHFLTDSTWLAPIKIALLSVHDLRGGGIKMGDMAKERELFEKYPRHIGLLVNAIKNALDKSHVVIKGGKLVLTTGGPTTTDSDHPTKNTDQDQ